MDYQRTIKDSTAFTGIGLHTGKRVRIELRPASPNSGITFIREDLGGVRIPARPESFSNADFATSIGNGGGSVQTVEHFMAALYCLGVDNLDVGIDGPEMPIMDGSAAPFIYMIHEAGIKTQTRPRRVIRILKPVKIVEGDKGIAIYPGETFRITYTIEFDHPLLRKQSRSFEIGEQVFAEEIAPARTFGFLKDVEKLRRNGLALGGSLENAIVIGENRILNKQLRFTDEFVRHKIVDAIGDLNFLGMRIQGHVVAQRAGHTLHIALVRELLAREDAYEVSKALLPAAEHAPDLGIAGSESYS